MQRYLYNAHAIGLAGHITIPFCDVIPGQATVALSSAGGFSSAKVEKFNYRDIITFDLATSFAAGSLTAKGYETVVTATVENLNILGVVKVDLITSRIVSHRAADLWDKNPSGDSESKPA